MNAMPFPVRSALAGHRMTRFRQNVYATYDKTREQLQMIAGTPDYVIPRIRKVLEVLRPGIFSFWLDGPVGLTLGERGS